MQPLARRDGILVRQLADEIVVYDLERHEAHGLNPTAALVFRHCDGRHSVGEIARRLGEDLGAPSDPRLVWLALEKLEEARLLAACPGAPEGVTRRELGRRLGPLGAAAVLLPFVTSLVVPPPAEAAVSSCVQESSCTSGNLGTPCYVTDPSAGCENNPACVCTGVGVCGSGAC
jgi:hypothetical protein